MRTLTLDETLAGAARAAERVAQWPQWKRDLSLPTCRTKDRGPCRFQLKPGPDIGINGVMPPKRKVPVPPASTDQWSFTSTDRDFDGARILREAAEAGFELVQVRREFNVDTIDVVTLATRGLLRRLDYADLFSACHWLQSEHGHAFGITTDSYGRLVQTIAPEGSPWVAVWKGLFPIERLLEKLDSRKPTTVKGWP